jgi:transcription antitermination factor NusG
MSSLQSAALPDEMKADMKQLQDKLNKEIEKVNSAYQKEYENSTVNDRPVKMDNLFKALAKHCKEIIKVYKELNENNFDRERFLFRGIKSSDDAVYGKPFEARKPKDSDRALHDLVNGTINNLGFEANRENAMFASGDRAQASKYGTLYIMFPMDGFKFTWSKTVKDLVLDSNKKLEMMDKEVVRQLRELIKKAKAESEDPSNFPIYAPDDLFYRGYQYERDVDLVSTAIDRGLLPDEAEDLLKNVLTDKSIQEHFEFTDQDIYGAILSEKEIYIKGNYYAVRLEHSKELFRFLESMDTDDVELPENFGEVPNILDKGDVVRILAGPHQGKLGTVTYVYGDTYEVFLTQKVGDTLLPKNKVELYHLPDGTIPIYEKDDKIIVTDPDSEYYGERGWVNFVYSSGNFEVSLLKNDNYVDFKPNQIVLLKNAPPELLKKMPGEYNLGDPVKIIDGEYKGYSGKVTYLYSNGKEAQVTIDGKSGQVDVLLTALEHVGSDSQPESEDSVGGIKVGDMVQVKNDDSTYYGQIGEVIGINQSASGNPSIKIKNDTYPSGVKTFVGWVKKVDKPEQSQQTFKAGDAVKIKDKYDTVNGKMATVIKGPDSDGDYKVITDDGDGLYTAAFQMEKIENTQSTFNIGDTVKIIDKSSGFFGMVGSINAGPDADGDYRVMFDEDDGEEWTYAKPDEMEKAEKPQQSQSSPTFAEGDTVKITGPSAYNNSSYIGYAGTITSVSDDGKFAGVRINGDEDTILDSILTYNVTNLVKSDAVNIDNLTWEPEPEVSSPAASKFEVNDRVEVVSGYPSLLGMKGKITHVIPKSGFVGVWLDGNSSASSFPVTSIKKIVYH